MSFSSRHLGSNENEIREMLAVVGEPSLDSLINHIVPAGIRLNRALDLPATRSEAEALAELKRIMSQNKLCKTYTGMGYYDCITPTVIQRNIL